MANKLTVALTQEQYETMILTMKKGGCGFTKNERIATALVLEANLGLRIGDILRLRLCDIIRDGNRYRLNITEEKTGKTRKFTVPVEIYDYIKDYAARNDITMHDRLFPITSRVVQQYIAKVAEYLDYENIGTHSFRKYFATQIYKNNGADIALTQHLMQHTSPATTARYIGIQSENIEAALAGHIFLV